MILYLSIKYVQYNYNYNYIIESFQYSILTINKVVHFIKHVTYFYHFFLLLFIYNFIFLKLHFLSISLNLMGAIKTQNVI